MKTFLLAILAAVALISQPTGSVSDPDAYAVYNAVIPSDWLIQNAHTTELLIQDTTAAPVPLQRDCQPSGPGLTKPWQEALNDFRARQTHPQQLRSTFSLPVAYRLETKDTIQRFHMGDPIYDWNAFHAAYPNAKGYLQLSMVGFDTAHAHAIVYMAHWCGGLCGQAEYHFVERTDGGWREVRLNVKTCVVVS